jgi:type IV pilus assembly protein PilA
MHNSNTRQGSIAKVTTAVPFGGFTLIELLVAVVIIGLLSAIALPSFLSQTAKAKGSEAKSSLGSINRAQQSYRWEKGRFANNLANLDVKPSAKFYSYLITTGNTTDAAATTTTRQEELKASSSAVTISGDVLIQIICESQDIQIGGTSALVPTGGNGAGFDCPTNYSVID